MKTLLHLLLLLPFTLLSQQDSTVLSQQDSAIMVDWENKLECYQTFIDSSLSLIDSSSTAEAVESVTDKMRKKSWQLEKFYRKNVKEYCESSDIHYLILSSTLAESSPALSSAYLAMYFAGDDECETERSIQKKFERIAHLSWRIKHTDNTDKLMKFESEIQEMTEDLLTYQ